MRESRGYGRLLFATLLLFLDGVLNIIYGLAAIGNSAFFEHPTHYLFGTLDAWGWVSLTIGVLELLASGSLLRGHRFGRYFGIAVGGLAAIGALLDIPGSPYWSLAVFAVSIWIIYGLAVYREPSSPEREIPEAELATMTTPVGPRPPL